MPAVCTSMERCLCVYERDVEGGGEVGREGDERVVCLADCEPDAGGRKVRGGIGLMEENV